MERLSDSRLAEIAEWPCVHAHFERPNMDEMTDMARELIERRNAEREVSKGIIAEDWHAGPVVVEEQVQK